MQQNNTTQKNRVYAPVMIGISLLFVIFGLYPLYTAYTDTRVEISGLEKTKSEKISKINAIKNMQAIFAGSGSNDLKVRVQKYTHPYNTSDIMASVMLNKYTASSTLTPAAINISSINVDTGRKLPNWLSMATVSLSLSADTPDQIVDYLTYLTTESAFAFTIDSISLPLDTGNIAANTTGVSLAIALGVYYYE
jgi:hypothetical protein